MRLATLPHSAASASSPATLFALTILLPLVLHAWLVQIGFSPVLSGGLVDTDSYMRLVRVAQLHDTGAWFDSVILRSNAPYGDDINWTRPLDAILLLGTWLLRPWFGFDDALFWTAAAIGPLGHVAVAFAAVWAARPLLPRASLPLVALGAFSHVEFYFESIAGRADHHGLILVLALIQAGLVIRALLAPSGGVRHAGAAGLAAAFGIWVSVELLLPLAASVAALGLAWAAAAGRNAARPGRSFAGALTLGLGIAIMVERPPAAYAAIEYDKVSLVHLALAFALAAMWTALAALDRQEGRPRTLKRRLAALGTMAAACGAVFVGLFPKFLLGPAADVDAATMDAFLDQTNEMRALWPVGLAGWGDLLVNLGPVLAAIPVLILLLCRGRTEPRWRGWAYLGVLTLAYAALSLLHQRFAPMASILVLPFLVRGVVWLEARLPQSGAAFGVAALLAAVLLPGIAGLALGPAAPAARHERCDAADTARWMAANLPQGTVMAHLNHGPVLLYWTRNGVVGGPYHRNREGIRDGFAFFASADDREAKRIAVVRDIEYVLLCPGEDRLAASVPDSLASRLADGAVPTWLRPLRIPDAEFRLFRVAR